MGQTAIRKGRSPRRPLARWYPANAWFGPRTVARRGRRPVRSGASRELAMSRIFFDTNLFIYLLEDTGERGAIVSDMVQRLSERRDELLTSTLTLAEVLVKPLSAGDEAWAARYERLLSTPGVSLLPFDRS